MKPHLGQTRTHIGVRHALIAPDGHVKSNVPGITGTATIVLISEALGAKFAQVLVTFEKDGRVELPANDVETAGYFETGGGWLVIGREKQRCLAGSFFFAPAGQSWSITSALLGTRVTLFHKKYAPLAGVPAPKGVIGSAAAIKGEPYLGDPKATLKVLLPDNPSFDLALNIFTYQPKATLPFVATHSMEQGLLMLSGEGICQLENDRHAVQKGDVIWMAPYCPQWFIAKGKVAASYLRYQSVNRAAL